MLGDPLTIGASYALAADMDAVAFGENTATYKLTVADVVYKATISHSYNKGRRRSMVRLDRTEIAESPFDAESSVTDTTSTYLVIDRSETLISDANVLAQVVELLGVLDAAAYENVTTTRLAKIVGGQS